MPATAERLTEQQLNAMRDRASHLLAPEGAQSWHQLDVTALLNEVNALQNSLDAARQEFKDDGIEADDLPLFVVAQQWKANATGIYEKKRFKEFRERLDDLAQTRDALKSEVEKLLKKCEQEQTYSIELERLLGELRDSASREREKFDAQLQAEQAELITAREEINKLNSALVDCVHRCEQVVQMQQAQFGQKLGVITEYLRHALEVAEE